MIARRRFLALAVATVAAHRLATAQTRGKVWRLGYLALAPLTDPPSPERSAFVAALREAGYAAGDNLVVEYRSAESDRERLPFLADELVKAKVDVIVVPSVDPARAALDATNSVPIVMLGVADPVVFGLVANLARPGANLTGSSWRSVDIIGKRFQLLREVLPLHDELCLEEGRLMLAHAAGDGEAAGALAGLKGRVDRLYGKVWGT